MIQEKQKLSGTLNNKQFLNGSLSNSVIYVDPITQEKTVIPTAGQQIVTPDEEYTGLSKVTVEAIQDENLISENIKNGVDILGVTGNYVGGKYAPRYISFYNYSGTELDEEIANLDTSNITKMSYMFNACNKLTSLKLSSFNTSNVTDMTGMFYNCQKLTTLDLSSFNTSNVTDMSGVFYNCSTLPSLDLSNFNTSNVTSMMQMFLGCGNITTLDFSSFNTANVTDMSNMFQNCSKLLDLNLSNFNTSKVKSMSNMFYGCQKLTLLDLSSFNTSNVTSMSYMFNNCLSLTTLKLTNFDTSKVTSFYQTFDRCNKIVSIPKLNASSSTNINNFAYSCKSLTDFGGLENLGQAYSTTSSANYGNYKLDLSTCTALTEQSIINVLNNLYDIKTKGCNTQQVVLGSDNLAKLTSTEGQQALSSATEKGWTVS